MASRRRTYADQTTRTEGAVRRFIRRTTALSTTAYSLTAAIASISTNWSALDRLVTTKNVLTGGSTGKYLRRASMMRGRNNTFVVKMVILMTSSKPRPADASTAPRFW